MPLAWLQRKNQAAPAPAPAISESNEQTEEANAQAQSLVKQLSAEILQALEPAQAQMAQLRELSPTLMERMLPLLESIDRVYAIAKSAQTFSDNPSQESAGPETLDAAYFFNSAITRRSEWMRSKSVLVRHALSSVQVHAKPSDFFTLADELLLWCADFSKDIAIQLDAVPVPGSDIPRARLRLSAAFSSAQTANQPSWQNARWLIWHKVAKRLDAKTELRTDVDRLILRISFQPLLASQQSKPIIATPPQPIQTIDRLRGLNVLVVSAHEERCVAVLQTLLPHGVICEAKPSVSKAHDVLHGRTLDAVIYDDDLPYESLQQIRRAPAIESMTAFLELHATGMQRDFQPSTSGAFTTGHVSVDAIERSLASSLSFELFKTLN